jgi:bacterioferritin
MDQQQLVANMNEDLRLEYRSIVQYNLHIATLKGMEVQSVIEELRRHISQELQHAIVLAEQIDFLGGVPAVTMPEVPVQTEAMAALRADLKLEQEQLERYRERVEQATDLALPDVVEALRPLLVQTQEHVRDLQAAVGD